MPRTANFYGLLTVVVEHGLLSNEEAQAAATTCSSQNRPFLSYLS